MKDEKKIGAPSKGGEKLTGIGVTVPLKMINKLGIERCRELSKAIITNAYEMALKD